MTQAIILDLETSTNDLFGRKASPFHPLNKIVAAGWQALGEDIRHAYSRNGLGDGVLAALLARAPKMLVGHNIKFDLLYLCRRPTDYAAYVQWVANGGVVWDTQLAEYLLEGQVRESHMISLDETAPRYGGNTKVDEVKLLWAQGVPTEDIDPELLIRYLVGGDDETGTFQEGDIGNTRIVFEGQLRRAKQNGQLRSILMNMGALLGSIEMELNGLYCDKPRGVEMAKELEAEIADLNAQLRAFLPELPFEFNWNSTRQRSALLFGGEVPYPRREYLLTSGEYVFTEGHPDQAFAQMEVREPVLDEAGEPVRFKSGKNAGEIKTRLLKVPDPSKPKTRMGQDLWQFPRMTEPKKEWAGADPGVYSTNSDVIEELGLRDIPFLKLLASLQAKTKDLGTYFIVWDEKKGEFTGMLSLVGDDGIIHHSLNHTSTVTGRFSASRPNSQNIPKGKKSRVKQLFVSRYHEGVIVQSDFSALEVYVQAWLTGCEGLLNDLRAGVDMHCKRLSEKTGRPYEEVYRLCKGYTKEDGTKVPPDKQWDSMRTDAKVFSFQRAYGAGAPKISVSTGIPLEDVEAMIEAEERMYPEITAYFEEVEREVRKTRRPTGLTVPHPSVRGVMCNLGRGFHVTPDGKRYAYTESPAPEYLVKKHIYASFSPTEIKNYSVQGTGAEVMKAAIWLAIRAFYRARLDGTLPHTKLINTVHDAQYLDAPANEALQAAALLHACMSQAAEFMRRWFSWEIPIPVPSDTTWGPSMAVEDGIDFPDELQTWALRSVSDLLPATK